MSGWWPKIPTSGTIKGKLCYSTQCSRKSTGKDGGLALLTSTNGNDWHPARYLKVLNKVIFRENGQPFDDKLERPCLYTEKGVPKQLFAAMGIWKRSHSMNVFVPLSFKNQ